MLVKRNYILTVLTKIKTKNSGFQIFYPVKQLVGFAFNKVLPFFVSLLSFFLIFSKVPVENINDKKNQYQVADWRNTDDNISKI